MSCGIENPQPIKGCTGPSQCCPGKRRHGGTEEQENADGSYSARHVVPNDSVGARVRPVSHLLTITRIVKRMSEFPEYMEAFYRITLSSVSGGCLNGKRFVIAATGFVRLRFPCEKE